MDGDILVCVVLALQADQTLTLRLGLFISGAAMIHGLQIVDHPTAAFNWLTHHQNQLVLIGNCFLFADDGWRLLDATNHEYNYIMRQIGLSEWSVAEKLQWPCSCIPR